MQTTGYRQLTQRVSANQATLHTGMPDTMKAFNELCRAALADGILDRGTKVLIALALGVTSRCDACIGFHVQALVKLGATRQDIDETLAVATYMGGGAALMSAASAVSAFEEFSRL